MRRSACLLLPALLLLGGCQGDAGHFHGGPMQIDSAGITIIRNVSPSGEWTLAPEPELTLGTLEGGPTEFFRVRDMAFLPGDRFAVANGGTEEIRIFSLEGHHLATVGRPGAGPGEFRGLIWLKAIGDSLLAYDGGNDRLTVRSSLGEYVRSFRLEWESGILTPAGLTRNHRIIAVNSRHMTDLSGDGVVLDSAAVSLFDMSGASIGALGRFPHNRRVIRREGEMQTTLGLPFAGMGRAIGWSDGFCYAFGPAHEIRCFDGEGNPRLYVEVMVEPVEVTQGDIDAFWDRELHSVNEARAGALARMRRYMEFPDVFPAFSRLEIDDQDRLWAQLYERPGATHLEWWIFEEGRWQARLRLEVGVELMAFAGERVLAVRRDEWGLEHVQLHRLLRD
jgi:hypothetical protein